MCLFFMILNPSWAQFDVSFNDALKIAANKINLDFDNFKNNKSYKKQNYSFQVDEKGDTLLHFFSSPSGGFIIISGDKRFEPILGYSDTNYLNLENPNPAFQFWIETQYNDIIKKIKKGDIVYKKDISQKWKNILKEDSSYKNNEIEVGSLLTTTWGQGQYYNEECPDLMCDLGEGTNALTGCVATAMAQIMKYYNYPANAYISSTIPSEGSYTATFNWNNMPNQLTSSNFDVAQLMRACGNSVGMNYGCNESGAYSENVSGVLEGKFSYETGQISSLNSDNVEQWLNWIRHEIDSDRPIYYAASEIAGVTGFLLGHAWVCDGYKDNGNFHMNWGWNGISNGWFFLEPGNSLVTQLEDGTEINFYSNHRIIRGIMPNNVAVSSIAPNLYLPNNNISEVNPNNINFNWSSITNANQYRLQIATGTSGWGPDWGFNPAYMIYDENIGNVNSIDLNSLGLSDCTTYYWSVRGGNNISSGPFAQPFSFTTSCDGGTTGSPDVFLQNAQVSPSNITEGITATASVDQYISPASSTATNVYLNYYLSTDPTYSVDDMFLGDDDSSIGGGDGYDGESDGFQILNTTPSGTYYILFIADVTNAVNESNENNNLVAVQITYSGNDNCVPIINITQDVLNGQYDEQHAGDEIFADNQIFAGAAADYVADNRITLQPGFIAHDGSNVTLKLGPCVGTSNKTEENSENEGVVQNEETGEVQANKLVNSIDNLTLFPNPANTQCNIRFQLQEANEVKVRIIDFTGRVVGENAFEGIQGTNQFQFETSQLIEGMYFIELQTPQAKEVQKVEILH